jgi:ADP-heptose:LPS heptosyltransferase
VLRLGALGDVVRTLPAVQALRDWYPGAHVSWMVERAAAGVLAGAPAVDEVLLFPREELGERLRRLEPVALARVLARVVRELRHRRFDLVLDFHGILKSGLLALAAGTRLRFGYGPPFAREAAWLFANRRALLPGAPISRFERNAALVRFLGVPASVETGATPLLRVDAEAAARLDAALGPEAAPLLIHPGTSAGTPYKRYTVDGYARVARSLAGEGEPVLVGAGSDPEERAFARSIAEASEGAARLAPETPRVADLTALLARARLLVGSDSGPLHLASLLGTPVVQILGPTHPVENAPWAGAPSRSVRVPVACSPCRRGCAAATCMRVVPPEAVVAAARELLADRDATPRAARPARAARGQPAAQGWTP